MSIVNCYVDVPVVQEIEGVPDEGYAPFYFPPEGDVLLFRFTAQSFLRVLSALRNGAYRTYREEGQQVIWDFLVNVEFPLSFCEQMIHCITTDTDVQQALADFIANNPLAQNALQSLIDNGSLLLPTGGGIYQTDDLDVLFGVCTYVTDMINEAITDFYQSYELSTNDRERGELVFSSIPVIETLPIDEISEYVSALEEDIAEGYLAQWTETPITGSRDRIRCAMFCAARANDNNLDWSVIEDYFYGRVGFTVGNVVNVVREMINFLVTGDWEGQEIVDISFANFVAAMRGNQTFGDQKFPEFAKIAALGKNNPDSDWMTLCEECPPEPETCSTANLSQDFRINQQGFEISHPEFFYARYVSGQGWATDPTNGNTYTISIERTITEAVNKCRVYSNQNYSGTIYIRTIRSAGWATITTTLVNSGMEGSLYFWEYEFAPITNTICYQFYLGTLDADTRIVRACEWFFA